MPKRKKLPSPLESEFDFMVRLHKWPMPEREYKFLTNRKFRFDFAWPKLKVAIELEGGIWSGGRHVRGEGFSRDCEKYNLAQSHGWVVLRFTKEMLRDPETIGFIERLFQGS